MNTILPRREICNVLRGSRSKVNPPEIKVARESLSQIYVASQNRQLTLEEDTAARGFIREIYQLKRLDPNREVRYDSRIS